MNKIAGMNAFSYPLRVTDAEMGNRGILHCFVGYPTAPILSTGLAVTLISTLNAL